MQQTVLVPVDGSDTAWEAFEHALERYDPQALVVLYVIDLMEGDYEVDEQEQPVKRSERIESETRRRTEEMDVDPTQVTFLTREGRPADEIIAQAATDDIEQVVMGSRGLSGVKRLLLGSVAETVVRRADVPVNVIR